MDVEQGVLSVCDRNDSYKRERNVGNIVNGDREETIQSKSFALAG